MPRTIEHIVSCHHAASAWRSAGKPVWGQQLPVKTIVNAINKDDKSSIVEGAKKIAGLVRASFPRKVEMGVEADFELIDIVDAFEAMQEVTDDVDSFDEWLDSLYDWADTNRVWLGS